MTVAVAIGARRRLPRLGLGAARSRLPALAALASVLAVWQVAALAFFDARSLPGPVAVAQQMWVDRAWYRPHIAQTVSEAATGFVWGVGIALALGVVFVLVPVLERAALRIVIATYCLPLIATAPILQIVLDDHAAKAAVAAQATLLIALVGITLGLRSVDRTHLEIIRCAGGGSVQQLRKARLRAAVPGVFTGLKIAAPSALLGAVIGEFLGGTRGLGVAMIVSQQAFFVERTWGLAMVMTALAAVAYGAFGLLGRLLAPWEATSTLNLGPAPEAPVGGIVRRAATSLTYLAVTVGLALWLWTTAIDVFELNAFFAKKPGDVWEFLVTGPVAGEDRAALLDALRLTLRNAGLGYLVGTVGALGLAVAVVANRSLEQAIMPVAIAVRSVPLVAMTPLIALLVGRGLWCVLVMSGIVTFFPSLVNLVDGLKGAPRGALDLAHAYGAGPLRALVKVRMPYALPSLFASARIAGPLAILGAVLAEWLATGEGIGNYMVVAQGTARYTAVWASVVVITVASVALYGAAGTAENLVLRRFSSGRPLADPPPAPRPPTPTGVPAPAGST